MLEAIKKAKRQAGRLAAVAVFWFTIPLILAVTLTCYARWDRTRAALDLLHALASEMQGPLEACAATTADARVACQEAVLAAKIKEQLGDKPSAPDAARARVLLRTIANDLGRPTMGETCHWWMAEPLFPRCSPKGENSTLIAYQQRIAYVLWKGWISTGLLLLFFPAAIMGLFMIDVFRARREIQEQPEVEAFEGHRQEILFDRNRRVLERRPFTLRRLGVMLMLSMGLSYVLAPVGLQTSILGDYTVLHPLPGMISSPFWMEQVRYASAASVGFLGFLVYTIMTLGKRVLNRDLSDRVFVTLLNRGLLVVMVSIAFGAFTEESSFWRAAVFLAGVFPQTAFEALGKYAQIKVASVVADESAGFEVLPEIDLAKQVTLRELGVNDANDLARTDLRSLVREVGIEPAVLLRAADRAVLVHYLGTAAAKRLESVPIYTACELIAYVKGHQTNRREAIARALGDEKNIAEGALEVQIDEIEKAPNVIYLRAVRERYGSY